VSAFDLDRFAPPDIRFKLDGREYVVDGDPDVDVIAKLLRIEEQIRESSSESEMAAGLQEGRDLVVEMLRQRDANIGEIRIGMSRLLQVFALIVHGPSVAEAVARAVSPSALGTGDGDSAVATAQNAHDETVRDGDPGPLGSGTSSPASSSSSADATDGRLVIGTA
jgi:hypothetical protein